MSKDFRARVIGIGLVEYVDRLVDEGFDSWDVLVDITEADLNDLGVKLGHRRKLQRAISDYKRQAKETSYSSTSDNVRGSDVCHGRHNSDGLARQSSGSGPQLVATSERVKRKYRRHPKPDPNAPERPASAYVIFSNHVRDSLRGNDLSFAEMAKLVGERWQLLHADAREQYESQASAAKEKYNAQLAEYKKTENYIIYQDYLADFKASAASSAYSTDGKRVRLTRAVSGNTADFDVESSEIATSRSASHMRRRSIVSASAQSTLSTPPEVVDERGTLQGVRSQDKSLAAHTSAHTSPISHGYEVYAVKSNSSSVALSMSPGYEPHSHFADSPLPRDNDNAPPSRSKSNVFRNLRLHSPSTYTQHRGGPPQLPPIMGSSDYPSPQPASSTQALHVRAMTPIEPLPALRTLIPPLQSLLTSSLGRSGNATSSLAPFRTTTSPPNEYGDLTRQGSALAALLQASELVRDNDCSSRPSASPYNHA